MQRKMPSEKAERLRRRDSDEHAQLRRQCLRWANDNAKALEQAAPPALACLNDRACDLWEPLLAIAERAAGEWPERARAAALALSGAGANEDDTRGNELLADVKKAFAACGLAELPTKALIAALCADPERPWAAYAKREQITDRQLAKLLRPFGIVSVTVHPPNALTQRATGALTSKRPGGGIYDRPFGGHYCFPCVRREAQRPSVQTPISSAFLGFLRASGNRFRTDANSLTYAHFMRVWTLGRSRTPNGRGRSDPAG